MPESEFARQTASFIDGVQAGTIWHLPGQFTLTDAVQAAALTESTAGAVVLSQRKARDEITSLAAAVVAMSGFSDEPAEESFTPRRIR